MITTGALTVTRPDALRRLHAALLVPNFPAEELISAEELVDGVASGSTLVHALPDPGTALATTDPDAAPPNTAGQDTADQDTADHSTADPVAVAIVERFTDSPAVLLAYLAIRADRRGRGLGTGLMRGLLAGIHEDPRVSVVLAEVEHPGHHEAHPVHGDPRARLRFYARLGAQALALPYFQPPVDAGSAPVYGMMLLVLDPPSGLVDADSQADVTRLVPAAGLAPALAELMAAADPDRHPVLAALAPTRDPRGVPMVPLTGSAWLAGPSGRPVADGAQVADVAGATGAGAPAGLDPLAAIPMALPPSDGVSTCDVSPDAGPPAGTVRGEAAAGA